MLTYATIYIDEEMVEMPQIGMACVARVPYQRPKTSKVVKIMEETHRVGIGIPQSIESRLEVSTPAPYAVEIMPST